MFVKNISSIEMVYKTKGKIYIILPNQIVSIPEHIVSFQELVDCYGKNIELVTESKSVQKKDTIRKVEKLEEVVEEIEVSEEGVTEESEEDGTETEEIKNTTELKENLDNLDIKQSLQDMSESEIIPYSVEDGTVEEIEVSEEGVTEESEEDGTETEEIKNTTEITKKQLTYREQLEEQAKELGLKGNIKNWGDKTLEKKVKEKLKEVG